MTTEEKFRAAVNVIRSLPKNGSYQPSHELMLRFYGFFKQATEGPCKMPRPAFWEVVKKMKWDAWNKLGNMSREDAMNNYVEELKKIVETMSYTDNVASFLGSLGSFYENVPQEDIELLVGPIIDRFRSQPGSPLSNSPFASREASPDRLQSVLNGRNHITSSLETSPASSYSASPLPPDGEEEEEEEEEFIDTVEAEPDRVIREPVQVTNISISSKKTDPANGHISSPGFTGINGVNGHSERKENVVNGNLAAHGRHRPSVRNACEIFVQESDVFRLPDQRQRVVRFPSTQDISEPIGDAVLQLQRDLERVTGRLNDLEIALSARNATIQSQVKPKSTYPSWWPFKGVSPQFVAFLVAWPFLVNAVIAILRRRKNNRLM